MVHRGVRFVAIIAYSFHVLVVGCNLFFGLASSHHDDPDYSFVLFVESTGRLADTIVDLDWASGSLCACTSSPLRAVPGSGGRFQN